MDIYPQDLGRKGYVMLLRHRTQPMDLSRAMSQEDTSYETMAPASEPLTPLRRLWIQGAGVDEETARCAQPAFELEGNTTSLFVAGSTPFLLVMGFALLAHSPAIAALLAGCVGVSCWRVGVAGPRRTLREMHRKLSAAEIGCLKKRMTDPLKRDYFELILTAIKMPPTGEEGAEKHVREALRVLGDSLESMPPETAPPVPDDPSALYAEAARVAEAAQTEGDTVVAASLERRADALTQRADAGRRIALMLRRRQALRQEIAEQIESLRASLAASSMGDKQNVQELARLAAGVQCVAQEAAATAAAREEVDAALDVDHPHATLQPIGLRSASRRINGRPHPARRD